MWCEKKIKETRFNTDTTSVINIKARKQTRFSSRYISYFIKIVLFLQRAEFVQQWVTSFILSVLCAHIVEDSSERENTKLTQEKENLIVWTALISYLVILETFIQLPLMDKSVVTLFEIHYTLILASCILSYVLQTLNEDQFSTFINFSTKIA